MWIFIFDESDKLLLWKKKAGTRFEQAAKQVKELFFPGDHQPLSLVVTTSTIITRYSSRMQRLPVEIIEIEEEEPQDLRQDQYSLFLSSAPWPGWPIRAARVESNPTRSNTFDTLPVNVSAPALPLKEDAEETRGLQRILEDNVPSLLPVVFLCYQQPYMAIGVQRRASRWCLMPLRKAGVRHSSSRPSSHTWKDTSFWSLLQTWFLRSSLVSGLKRWDSRAMLTVASWLSFKVWYITRSTWRRPYRTRTIGSSRIWSSTRNRSWRKSDRRCQRGVVLPNQPTVDRVLGDWRGENMRWFWSSGPGYIYWRAAGPLRPAWSRDAIAQATGKWWTILPKWVRSRGPRWAKDLDHRKQKSPGFFSMVTGPEGTVLYVFWCTQFFVLLGVCE